MSPFSNSPFSNSPFESSKPPSVAAPLSPGADGAGSSQTNQGAGCFLAFSAVFALIGALMFFSLFLRPVLRVVEARNWPAVPCRITSSVVTRHTDSDGTSYSAAIVYTYTYGSQSYKSGAFSFGNTTRSGLRDRRRVAALYPPGRAFTCFVNPKKPGDAVLKRGVGSEILKGLFSLPFLGFGLLGLCAARRLKRDEKRNESNPRSEWRLEPPGATDWDSLVLRPTSSPMARFIGLGLMALFWNGIILVIARDALWRGGGFGVFSALFLIPFALIGAAMLYTWTRAALALGNARPSITLLGAPLHPGHAARLEFGLSGGLFWPRSVEITLEGCEEAIFTRGTDTITDRSTFYFQTLPLAGTVQSGSCALTIPPDAMHSFEAGHNKIVWMLKLRGPIKGWPGIEEE